MKKIIRFFDVLEDKIRARLSRRPVIYGVVSGIGIVMFYRGIWMVLDGYPLFTGWVTLVIATILMLLSGVFVSQFVGNNIIISGIKREKKLVERVGDHITTETGYFQEINDRLKKIEEEIANFKK